MIRVPLLLSLALPAALAVPAAAVAVPATTPAAVAGLSTAAPARAVVDPDPADRESMRQGWLQILKPAMQVPIGWNGSLSPGCDPGAPSPAAQEATLTAVNYFRDLVGVEPVTFDATLSAKAQKAALMMAANGSLSHDPPDTWACYTADGHAAAGKSNLALGNAGASAIAAYMEDGGSGNELAGHRRWIIDPRQTTMGSGSVQGSGWQSTSNALYVLDGASFQPTPASTPEFLPWPVAGYHPIQVEPDGRWSLSAKGAVDFSSATVKINGSSAGVTVHPVSSFYGPNTLVWNFDPAFDPGDADRTYHVVVSGIAGASTSTYAYDVTLFDAEAAPVTDETPPTVTPLDPSFRVELGLFDVGWDITDASGISATWRRERTRTPTTTFGAWTKSGRLGSPDLAGESSAPGSTRCWSARARDTEANLSPWSKVVCVHTPVDDGTLVASEGWRSTSDPSLWNGSARTTKQKGSTLQLAGSTDVDRLGVVATRCPTCGKVRVVVGKTVVGVLSLKGPATQRSVILLPPLTEPLSGRVRLVVLSTGEKVEIDGLIASSR